MSKRKEDVMLRVENSEIYSYYHNRLTNLALSQFEWHGLPETIDRWYMEKTLFNHGSVAFYRPIGADMWLATSWLHKSGQFDVYGRPTDVYGVDFNGRNISVDEFHLIYDNNSVDRSPLISKIDVYAKLLWETHQTFRQNLMHQNTPYIVATTKTEMLSVKNLFNRIFNYDPVIELRGGMSGSLDENIKALDTRVDFKGPEILETRRELWKDALSMLGITSETTKKERLIEDEISINRQEDTIALNARLLNRVEFCNKMNDLHGMELSVNISETAVSTTELMEPTPRASAPAPDNNEQE